MKKLSIALALFFIFNLASTAQRRMENLDRGLVAVKVPDGVFLSWRIPATEWYNTTWNVYRDGTKLNAEPLGVSNFKDLTGTLQAGYSVTAIRAGKESTACSPVQPLTKQYREIVLKPRNTAVYQINDATAADLDGDGEYEIIVKRIAPGWNEDNTSYSFFEAYKADGTLLWEINVGPNILPDVEINIAAFDFDNDNKAEVFMRTSEGTIFGDGKQIGDTDSDGRTNYRYSVGTTANMQYMNAGPEFLSLIDGLTGGELDRVPFIPRGQSADWGDNYGHRASKYFFGAPFLDGLKPSLFTGRGIYTKTIMRTYNVVNKKLVFRWEFNSGDSGPYFGQGNHNYTIADVDGDGRDEIVWGSMTVDDDGKGLYSTQMGHGDALHVGDMDPFRKGIEIFKCLENSPVWGTVFYDGATGEILIHNLYTKDCGRCCAANISDEIQGKALWGGEKMFSASSRETVGISGGRENFRIYWDGDLLEELTDHEGFTTDKGYGTGAIFKYGTAGPVLFATGAISCNYTKGTPSLQADLFGDWREEVVWRNEENTAIRIYTTVDPTIYRNYTLMHDHQYRQAICWQMCAYNQPPHVSYFLGEAEGKTIPPPPAITNDRLVYTGTGDWIKSASVWKKDGVPSAFTDGSQVLFDISGGNNIQVALRDTVSPEVLTVNSPGNCNLEATQGKLGGMMTLVKQGEGTLTLNGRHDFTGKTEIWGGTLVFKGDLLKSHVWAGFFGKIQASGKLGKGLTLSYGSEFNTGADTLNGQLTVEGDVQVDRGAILTLDLYAPSSVRNDSLHISGDVMLSDGMIFSIRPHQPAEGKALTGGEYILLTVDSSLTADLSKVEVRGISGLPYTLKYRDHRIILEIKTQRQASMVIWNGKAGNGDWDLTVTPNFLNAGSDDIFVTGDDVVFTDAAANRQVNLVGELLPGSVWVNNTQSYVFDGSGRIAGNALLKKSGSGKLTINNTNSFTGKVLITEGVLEVSGMPGEQSPGAIGASSPVASNLEIDGGTLRITGDGAAYRAATLGPSGGTIETTGKQYWYEILAGNTLLKMGYGNLVLGGVNTHNKTILKQGTLTLLNEGTNPGKTIVLEGGILQCYDNSGTYSNLNWNMEVPEGKTTTVNLDSRAYYNGTLTGAGTINMNIPFIRSDFKGDWSSFSGRINFTSTRNTADGFAEARFNNSYGLEKASVNLGINVTAKNLANTPFKIGELTGTGELSGAHNWIIGSRNSNAVFDGTIVAGSINKTGSGTFMLTNSNIYNGGTIVEAGTLVLANPSGSATGYGDVAVRKGATLAGTGSASGSLIIESSGAVSPGIASIGKLTSSKGFILNSQTYFTADVNTLTGEADQLVTQGTVQVNGILWLTKKNPALYAEGNSFKIISSPKITGSFQSIIPATPGEGLQWDLTELNSAGIIKVVKATTPVLDNEIAEIKLFPNPAGEKLLLDASGLRGVLSITIFDSHGKPVTNRSSQGGRVIDLPIGNLPRGIYYVKIENGEKTFGRKFVKE